MCTFLPNFDPNPFIIESALVEDFIKVNSNGFSGENAKITFTSGEPHTYEVKSTNDFIQTPPDGNEIFLLLSKNISESIYTSVESAGQSSSPSNINTIELEITASQISITSCLSLYFSVCLSCIRFTPLAGCFLSNTRFISLSLSAPNTSLNFTEAYVE